MRVKFEKQNERMDNFRLKGKINSTTELKEETIKIIRTKF
jgi:hypothetical protein